VSLVATMLARVLEARGNRPAPEQLSLVLLGGGPASQSLLERAVSLGYPIAPTYGLTEAASQVATRPPRASLPDRTDLSAGLRPLPGVEIRIVDSEGKICAADAAGEIEVRGPIVMQGYLEDPTATAATLRDGWLATGDIGRIDRDGGLRVLDRRADLIVSGGENVYPAEVEAVLVSHEAVQDAGVIGRSDSEFGARPTAFIVAAPGATIVRSALDTYCRGRLAAYKVPVEFTEVESLPRTASGKLQRSALVAIAPEDPIDSAGPT
jgi:O-succinylbenzoic acid--CoA ligase